ncbi:MAG: DUF4145 domain-containing protein [Myxococcales bacterium]
MQTQEWQCPSCGLSTDVAAERVQMAQVHTRDDNALGPRAFRIALIVCPNRLCRQPHVRATMHQVVADPSGKLGVNPEAMRDWELVPGAAGRQLPHYVPESIAEEFAQAGQIVKIAPAAAGALARRCLQALVRDFWNVKKTFLADELDAIKDRIDPETWEAIDSVRNTGNIGKHFEKGANVIIEVEPEEPEMLLKLIEYLVEDWYVARRRRQQRLAAIKGRSIAPGGDG